MPQQIKTFKLRTGQIVYAKKENWPVSYGNFTAAVKAETKLKEQGVNCEVIQMPGSRCIYIRIIDNIDTLTLELTALINEVTKLEKKIKEVENKIRELQIKSL